MATRHHHGHRPTKQAKKGWQAKPVSVIPPGVLVALQEAMRREAVPPSDLNDLAWIMAQESAGVVNARNAHSSARGLFQLLAAQYDLNPNGEASFGNAVEESQGGIHYIYGRYHTAKNARAFWEKHHWY